ncbi:MAG: hypothetical protein QF664_05435 [Dehalococcoidia bacterium]|jgi:hypothetical protein|nr:hypothetical protein [Dehalococcoidia bacterium]
MFERVRSLFSSKPAGPWQPSDYRVVATEAGANVNYDCYCGCDAGIAFDRADAEQEAGSCCCGNLIQVGAGAVARLNRQLTDPAAYRIAVQSVAMPWGEQSDVALAIPEQPAP